MDPRPEQLLLAIIDDMLRERVDPAGMRSADVQNVLLDVRLAVTQIASLEWDIDSAARDRGHFGRPRRARVSPLIG